MSEPESEMSYGAKSMLYTIGIMNRLRDSGLIEGGFDLSESGQKKFAALEASGFRPTTEELQACTRFLCCEEAMRGSP